MEATKVLVVDDDRVICDLLVAFLNQEGFDASSVASGEEAIEEFDNVGHHIVITDLKMPGLNGLDVLRHVKDAANQTVVIMITGSCSDSDRLEAYDNGVDAYLGKPFNIEDLLDNMVLSPQ